jgi:Domain of unknown function (DUF4129)
MPADKPRPTLADYVTIALSPALIIVMITSLVFFLVTILYRGEFVGRLEQVLFFYIFGIVLVARISMEAGIAERAPLYGAVLAFAVWLGMWKFVDYPPDLEASSWLINAGLIALVWWLAYRLTYSCTYIDEKAEATGVGVLQAAGLEVGSTATAPPTDGTPSSSADSSPTPRPSSLAPRSTPTWWQRYQRYRDEQKKKNTPGVWVVYFGLAALPIFGLGQALLDVDDGERRAYTLWLMGWYVASSLGLLVTTSFLGLRRYLRQRNLKMPAAMTGAWLAVGGGLLAAFVLIGALLPRPQAEFSILNLTPAGSKPRDASPHAMTRGNPGEGEGRAGAQKRDPKGDPVDSKNSKEQGQGGKGQAKGQGDGKKGEQKGNADDQSKQNQTKGDEQGNQEKQETQKKSGETRTSQQAASRDNRETGSRMSSPPWLAKIAQALKWIFFIVLAVAAVIFILRGGLRYLANFCDWARRLLEALRRFWEGLFLRRRGESSSEAESGEQALTARQPFLAFANPFLDGRADGMLPADLVRYSFEALAAWGDENGLGRTVDETPIEFANRVAATAPKLGAETQRLGALYARVLYSQGALPPTWREAMEKFWEQIDASLAQSR